jgi:hypothetical protein
MVKGALLGHIDEHFGSIRKTVGRMITGDCSGDNPAIHAVRRANEIGMGLESTS